MLVYEKEIGISLICNGCGWEEYFSTEDAEEAESNAEMMGWSVNDDEHLCPECAERQGVPLL